MHGQQNIKKCYVTYCGISGSRVNQPGFMDVRIVARRIVLYRTFLVLVPSVPQLSRDGPADSGFVWDKTAVVCATIKERLCTLSSLILTTKTEKKRLRVWNRDQRSALRLVLLHCNLGCCSPLAGLLVSSLRQSCLL